ncbi:MAG: endoribonuclease MazF [Pseudomonadota bacterium]
MRPKGEYVPERGDAVWITLDPQAGNEQAGSRPALVLSPSAYNGRVGLALLCPITTQVKGYPFEVLLPAGLPVTGVVGADQVKSLDWRARKATRIAAVPKEIVSQVVTRLQALLEEHC